MAQKAQGSPGCLSTVEGDVGTDYLAVGAIEVSAARHQKLALAATPGTSPSLDYRKSRQDWFLRGNQAMGTKPRGSDSRGAFFLW